MPPSEKDYIIGSHLLGCTCVDCSPRPDVGSHPAGCTCEDCSARRESPSHPSGCTCVDCSPRPEAGSHPSGCTCVDCSARPEAGSHPSGCTCEDCSPRPEAGSHPAGCACEDCSPRPRAQNIPKRDNRPSRWVVFWRRFQHTDWTNTVLLVSSCMSLAVFALYPAALAGWVEENLQTQKQADPPTSSSGFDLPPTSDLRPVSPVGQMDPAGGFLPASELEQYHQQLLALINADREAHALYPVVLGNNTAAQGHAEDMVRQDYISHWDPLGLTPYMRYTLAGGSAYEAENVALGYGGNSIAESVEEAQKWLMNSPGHKENILDKWHNRVNLGVACDESVCAAVQQFESDYVVFSVQPTILNGILRFAGNMKGDFTFQGAHLWYDQPPHPLTSGQLDATYSYSAGQQPATFLRKPPGENSYYPETSAQHSYRRLRWTHIR